MAIPIVTIPDGLDRATAVDGADTRADLSLVTHTPAARLAPEVGHASFHILPRPLSTRYRSPFEPDQVPSSTPYLLLVALLAIAVLVVLVTGRKWNPFIALLAASIVVGSCVQMGPVGALTSFQQGLGDTLGGIAAIIALGAMFGKLLSESGGAQVLARRGIEYFGPQRAVLCISLLATVIGVVTWFAVGLLLLLPVMLTIARESRRPVMLLAIPMLAFLSTMHGLTPPHPGPVVAINALEAEVGLTLLLALAVGIPTAIVAGPLFARCIVPRLPETTGNSIIAPAVGRDAAPGFGSTLFVVALPVALLLLSTFTGLILAPGSRASSTLLFLGHPVVALSVAVLLAAAVFARASGFSRAEVLSFSEQSVAAIGMVLLVVGGGGGFARVLRDAGIAGAMGDMATMMSLPPLVYGWLVAAFIRVATGSATVGITAASGLLAPIVATDPAISRELLVLAMGFGSLFLSHLNDGGFWIVKEILGLSVKETFKTWTALESIIGIVGLGFTLALDLVV
ncbi:MAG: GntP family permease [Gemmatimonadetes bacterium]|nr:GntP family permease [Gemmatimonadota bacterium]